MIGPEFRLIADHSCQWNHAPSRRCTLRLIRIDVHLVAKAVAESPDGQVLAPCVLKGVHLDIAEQIADDVPRSKRQAFIAIVQRGATTSRISSWQRCL